MGAGQTKWIGNEKSASHRQSRRLTGFRRGKGVSQAPIGQRRSEGLFSLVVMYASQFRNCVSTERNRIGGPRKKRGSQKTRATLRRDVHAALEALEARGGAKQVRREAAQAKADVGRRLPLITRH